VSEAVLEGRLHPLAVLVIARRFVGVSILPLIALFLAQGNRVVIPALLVALFVGLPLALLSWWRFRYRVSGGRLELHSGVFSRSVRTIPRERVRGIDVTEPFLHRLLGLVKVDVEAAAGGGGKKAELSLAAISRAQADSLREALLGGGRPAEEAAEPEPLYRATPGLLALGGLTSMGYLLAPAAIVGVVANLADDLPGGFVERAASRPTRSGSRSSVWQPSRSCSSRRPPARSSSTGTSPFATRASGSGRPAGSSRAASSTSTASGSGEPTSGTRRCGGRSASPG
jgi:membrane protein YdbS with pleckstrin-like domain